MSHSLNVLKEQSDPICYEVCLGSKATLLDLRGIVERAGRKVLLSTILAMKCLPAGPRAAVFSPPLCDLKQATQVLAGSMTGQPPRHSELSPASWYTLSCLLFALNAISGGLPALALLHAVLGNTDEAFCPCFLRCSQSQIQTAAEVPRVDRTQL